MRWDRLFADLEAQFEEAERAELAAEVADRIRREHATIKLLDRLRARVGEPVQVQLLGGELLSGPITFVGADWVLIQVGTNREAVLPLTAVGGVRNLGSEAVVAVGAGSLDARLRLGYVLRALARDRATVQVATLHGTRFAGTVDRVGEDHFDLAEHAAGETRRSAMVRSTLSVPFAAVAVIERQ